MLLTVYHPFNLRIVQTQMSDSSTIVTATTATKISHPLIMIRINVDNIKILWYWPRLILFSNSFCLVTNIHSM